MTPLDKKQARAIFGPPDISRSFAMAGKLAEKLRRLESYRQSSQVFIDPSPLLKQARINVLADGKVLIMPGPGLKEGFYRLDPYSIPFGKLPLAVNGRELPSFGRRLTSSKELGKLKIDLLIGEYWALDDKGHGLGEGKGFFDLAVALLADTGALADEFLIVAAINDAARMVQGVSADVWDIPCDRGVSPGGLIEIKSHKHKRPRIIWEALILDRIRRITPLWKLYVEQGRDLQD